MGEIDVTFRSLLRALPQPLLRLAFPGHVIEPLGAFDASVDRPRQRTSDNLFRVRYRDFIAAIHVEIERDWRTDIPQRLFEYATVAMSSPRLPVWTVVVLLRSGGRPPLHGIYRVPGIEDDAVVFRYRVVPLWQLDAQTMSSQLGPSGAPFCVAMHGANEAFARKLAQELQADRVMSESDRQNTTQLLYVVVAAILGSNVARRIFHVESIIQDPNVQELIAEWENKGVVRGLSQGRAEGLSQGRAEAFASALVDARVRLYKVLDARSFFVPPDARARVDCELDRARLESWLEAAVTAASLDDIFRGG